jgi:hypothetical protein
VNKFFLQKSVKRAEEATNYQKQHAFYLKTPKKSQYFFKEVGVVPMCLRK